MSRDSDDRRDLQALVKSAFAFHRAQPWRRFDDDQFLALELPRESETWFVVVLGCAGTEFGLHMAKGAAGLALLRSWSSGAPPNREATLSVQQIGFTLGRAEDLPPALRTRLARAGSSFRREALAPTIFAVDKRGRGGLPDRRAIRTLLQTTTALLRALKDLRFPDPGLTTLPVFAVTGSPRRCGVSITTREFPFPDAPPALSADPSELPAEGDVAAWRAVEHRAITRTLDRCGARGWPDDAVMAAYYGPAGPPSDPERMNESTSPWIEWAVGHHRRFPGDPTILAGLLADSRLPAAERVVLEARARSHPTAVRVLDVDPETGFFTVEDLFDGSTTRFHDLSLSRSVREDICLLVSLVAVPGVVLPYTAGPALLPLEVSPMLSFLESCGLTPSPEGLRKKSHLLGRLWAWIDEHRSASRQMVNNDGDLLELCEMVLHAADPAGVRRALEEYPEIERDERDDTYVWLRPFDAEIDPSGFEDGVLVARLRIIGEEVLVSSNSRERADLVREWFCDLPDVRFVSETVRAWDAPPEAPLDDRLPSAAENDGPSPEELLEFVHGMLDKQYTDWLDSALPALSGRSPREAAEDPASRAYVAVMIRTIPSPAEGFDLAALQARLLRELGLD